MVKKSLLIMMLLALFAPWAANAQTLTLTVCNGTDNSQYVPFEGYNADSQQHNQMIFPATDLTAMNGKEITQMVFYIDQSASNGSYTAADRLGTWTVSLGETEATTLSGLDNTTTLTQVYQGYFDCSTGTLTLAFSSNYLYLGGNLLVDLNHAASGWNTWYFLGVKQTENTAITRGSLYKFLPKTTFSYQTPPTCPAPGLAAAQNITDSQASFSWTENGSATNWVLQYSTSEEFTNATSVNVQDTPAKAINDFQPLTTYYVRVKADCGEGDQSQWSNVISFSTTAVAEAVGEAWSDDFEGASCGWELINGTLTNKWCWGTAVNNGGTHALYVSNDNGVTDNYSGDNTKIFATKLLNFTDGKFEFTYDWRCKGESTYDFLRVALVPASQTLTAGTDYSTITQPNLPTGWIALDGGKLNLQETWQSKDVAINVAAGNYYLVLAWRNETGAYSPAAAVDNVSITRVACPYDVTGLAVSEITTTSATLSWNGGEATQWQVAYSTASNFEGATEEIVSNASYDMSGLQSSSTYFVKVRAYCGGEDFGTWCQAISFATACDAITTFPWSEDFESYSASSSGIKFEDPCWENIHLEGAGTYFFEVYSAPDGTNGTNGTLGAKQLRLRDMNSGTMTKLRLPEMNLPTGDNYLFSIDVYRNTSGSSYTSEGVRVFASTDGEIEDATELGFLYRNCDQTDGGVVTAETSPGWYTYEFPIPMTGTCYIVLRGESQYGSSTYMDNFKVKKELPCVKPSIPTFESSTTTSATLSWTNGAEGQTAWQIAYSTNPNFNPDEVTPVDVTSNPGTINGLTASTTYYAYVRANCGDLGYSEWSTAYCQFATECEAITVLPWNENFDAYTGSTSSTVPTGYPNDELPTCWQFLNRSDNSSTYPQVFISSNSGYPVSGNCLFFKSSSTTPLYAVLPAFEEEIAALQLTFTYRNEGTNTSNNGTLIVGYMTNPADATTFTTVLTCERTTTLTEKEAQFTNAPTGSYIAFMYQGGTNDNYYLSIDNVKVDFIPTCTKPTDLAFVSSTATTATLSWTAGADETAWQICLNGDEENLIEANSNPFTVEGLTASTSYTAKVRAYCSADDQSDWSNEVSFATACEAIVVDAANPFTEGFEGDWTPLCWESIPYIDGTTTRQWTKNTNSSYIHTGAGAAYSSYYGPIYLVMPDLQLGTDGDAVQLTFWSYNSWTDAYYKNSVVLLNGENEIELWSPESVVNSWEETTIDLTAYMGQTISLAFKYEGNNAHGWYVDDVEVNMIKTFTKTIGAHSAEGEDMSGWYLIASPLYLSIPVESVDHMTDNEFDLYRFNQAPTVNGEGEYLEWENYKSHTEGFLIESGIGYLYANSGNVTLTFTGAAYEKVNPYDKMIVLSNTEDNPDENMRGWNLVGNPYSVKAYPRRDFYVMNPDGNDIVTPERNYIEPMEGAFVYAAQNGEELTFYKTESSTGNKGALSINVVKAANHRGNGLIDRAVVRFGEGNVLPKFMLNQNHTKVYIPQGNKDCAVVYSESQGEMPLNFRANENGTYTLSFNADEVSFNYLHLIDNMTGVDVDLLQAPSYTFNATTTDYTSRFKLVFCTGVNNDCDNFAFFSNGTWVIGNEGEATLQVIDVTGRVLSSETVNGSVSKAINAAPGVYMLRLINGDNVKVQKIVVR